MKGKKGKTKKPKGKDLVFEATSVFEAATKKTIAVPKQKPKALFHLLRFFSLIDYTTPLWVKEI